MNYWTWIWLGLGGVALMALLWESWLCLECWWNARKMKRRYGKTNYEWLKRYTNMEL